MGEIDKFKERAYKILYEKYKGIIDHLIHESSSIQNKCSKTGDLLEEDRPEYITRKVEAFENLSKLEEWSKNGIISGTDIEIIKTLEYCLGKKYKLSEKTR